MSSDRLWPSSLAASFGGVFFSCLPRTALMLITALPSHLCSGGGGARGSGEENTKLPTQFGAPQDVGPLRRDQAAGLCQVQGLAVQGAFGYAAGKNCHILAAIGTHCADFSTFHSDSPFAVLPNNWLSLEGRASQNLPTTIHIPIAPTP